MNQNLDSRNRLPGTSIHKKRKTGRKEKRDICKKRKLLPVSSTSAKSNSDAQARSSAVHDKTKTSTATRTTQRTNSDTLPSTSSADTIRPIIQPSTSGSSKQFEQPRFPESRSSKKLNFKTVEASPISYRIIDISLLFPGLEEFLVCQNCYGSVKCTEVDIKGLGSQITITCTGCNHVAFIDSSKKVGKKGNAYEINKRVVLAMRSLGHGHAGLSTFCGKMDLPSPISHSNFDVINKELNLVCQKVAQESMKAAIEENSKTSENLDISVSGDGTWRKRGHNSLQGVSSLIRNENGKVVNIAVKQSFCRACELHPEQDTEEYREWFEEHKNNYSANHTGNSGMMEVSGIVGMFKGSEHSIE